MRGLGKPLRLLFEGEGRQRRLINDEKLAR